MVIAVVLVVGCQSFHARKDEVDTPGTGHAHGHSTYYEDKVYTFVVNDGPDLPNYPAWKISDPGLPLSFTEAISLASKRLASIFPGGRTWEVTGLRLEALGFKGYWYYLITFLPEDDGTGAERCYFDVPVYLNGLTVRPTISPNPRNAKTHDGNSGRQ